MSVRRAQKEIDAYEFAEWSVFNRIDPPAELRADIHTAMIRQTTIQCHGDKNTQVPDLKNLIIDFWNTVKFPGKEVVWEKMKRWKASREQDRERMKQRKKK